MQNKTRKITAIAVVIFLLVGAIFSANPVLGENLTEETLDEMKRENTDTDEPDLTTGISDNSDSTYGADTDNEQIDESNEPDVIEDSKDVQTETPEGSELPTGGEETGDNTQNNNSDDSDEPMEPKNPENSDETEEPTEQPIDKEDDENPNETDDKSESHSEEDSELTDSEDDEDGDTQYDNPEEDPDASEEPEETEGAELPAEGDNTQDEPEDPENPEELIELPDGEEGEIEPVIPIEELPIIPLPTENPALEVYLYTDRDVYRPGETIEFEAVLENIGDVDLENVTVYVKSSFGMVDGLIGTLNPGEETAFKGEFKIKPGFEMEYLDIEAAAKGMYLDTMVMAADSCQVEIMTEYNPFIEVLVTPEMDMQSHRGPQLFEEEAALDYGPPKSVILPEFVKSASTEDTIAVDKTAEPSSVCRTYDVRLGITGVPAPAPVDVVLVIDRSGSMNAGSPSSMYYVKQAAREFTDNVLADGNNRVAVVSFAGKSSPGFWPNYNYGSANDAKQEIALSHSAMAVKNAINGITADGGTNIEAGFLKAKDVLNNGREDANKVIILLTDGVATWSIGNRFLTNEPTQHNVHTIAAYTEGQGCCDVSMVFTVGLLNSITNQTTRGIARETLQWAQNAGYYEAVGAPDLSDIYNEISGNLGYSATNAIVTDVIHGDFELVEGSITPSPNAPVSYNTGNQTITWKPGTITTLSELTYKIRAKDGVKGNNLPTNESAVLNYTDINGNNSQQTFEVPEVNVIGIDVRDDLTIVIGDSVNISDDLEVYGYSPFQYEWTNNTDPDWSSSEKDPKLQYPEEDTAYTIEITDSQGCKATGSFSVTVKKGKIKIKKIVEQGIGGIDTDKEFVVHVDGPSGREWNTFIKHGENKKIGNLRPGDYHITEIIPMDYRLISIDNPNINITRDMILEDEVVSVTVKNTKVNDSWFRDETEVDNYFTLAVSWSSEAPTRRRDTEEPPLLKEEILEAVLQDDREYITSLPEENEDETE